MALRPTVLALASLCSLTSGGSPLAASPGPSIALVATRVDAEHSTLHFVRPGDAAVPGPVATFGHLAGAVVRAASLPSGAVVAVADTAATRDASFAASLIRVAPHAPPVILCDRVVHASRPLVTAAGRLFVSRGKAGPEVAGTARVDELSVDEVDPATSAAHPIHTYAGYLTFLAGDLGREIFLYRVGPGGADLVAVDADSGATRVVLPDLLPYARDFSVDRSAGALVFVERHEVDRRTWVVDRLDLASGARTRLATGDSLALAPFAWSGGGVAWNPGGREGLRLLGAGKLAGPPLGAGVDLVQAVSSDRAWVSGLHTVAGRLPEPFAIDVKSGVAATLPVPPGARVTVAGFVAGGAK